MKKYLILFCLFFMLLQLPASSFAICVEGQCSYNPGNVFNAGAGYTGIEYSIEVYGIDNYDVFDSA